MLAAVWLGFVYCYCFCFPMGQWLWLTNDSLLIQIGVGYLRITAGGYLAACCPAVYVSLERSTGNPKLGTIILLFLSP